MKTIILLILISSQSIASDLIFTHGFEQGVSLSGTASGLVSTGLSLRLKIGSNTEVLNVNTDGVFVFAFEMLIGFDWSVEVVTLPNSPQQQNCVLSNSSGTIGALGYNGVSITCDSTAWKWDEMNWNQGGWN